MNWYYACVKRKPVVGDGYEYHLVEVYPGLIEGNDTPAYADNAAFIADSPEELAEWLRIAADDIEKHGVINDA